MYISDKFVYTELHKTAGTHLGKWLDILAPGEQVGKHNVIPANLRDRPIIGSIRNPWDWYVSLWGYGCDKRGSVWYQTTDGVNLRYYWQQLSDEMGMAYPTLPIVLRQLMADLNKPKAEWAEAYADSTDPECFKKWLKLVFSQERKLDLREGYGFSGISDVAGILSYRFFKFFTDLGDRIYDKGLLHNGATLEGLWADHKIASHFIRMEHLEDDLLKVMAAVGIEVSDTNRAELLAAKDKKTNTSSRLPASHYYDDESIALVRNSESFLIDTFGYEPPKR